MATAQVNRRRTALAEIPVRMSQLRVSTDEVPVLLNRTVIDSPLDNIPLGYLTPSPSQDECNNLPLNSPKFVHIAIPSLSPMPYIFILCLFVYSFQ